MIYSDIYTHYKGQDYVFNGIAVPLQSTHIIEIDTSTSVHTARHTETGEDIKIFYFLGITIADYLEPLVMYQSARNFHALEYWVRPVDMFFGHTKLNDGTEVKRFTKKTNW